MTEERQPWWLRALEPLRSEAAMFRLFLRVGAAAIVVVGGVLIGRALF